MDRIREVEGQRLLDSGERYPIGKPTDTVEEPGLASKMVSGTMEFLHRNRVLLLQLFFMVIGWFSINVILYMISVGIDHANPNPETCWGVWSHPKIMIVLSCINALFLSIIGINVLDSYKRRSRGY